jgi:prepilin-type N-terminal cleavage/methylation domain-containing protein
MRIRKGFSLIEIMVAISLFAILSISITLIAAGILRGAARAQVQTKVRNEAQYAMSVISQATRFASDVNLTSCNPTSYTIRQRPSSTVLTTYSCDVANTTLKQDGLELIGPEVVISACSFACDATNKTITVHFEAKDEGGLMNNPIIFDSQIILRNKN